MLFISKEFIFFFFPVIALASIFILKIYNNIKIYKILLILASFIFYGLWSFKFLLFFLSLIILNYTATLYYKKIKIENYQLLIIFIIIINLFILFYFKYYNFLIENINQVFELNFNFKNIILPLGISFIVFQQIGYLWTSIGSSRKVSLVEYLFFSLFFPQIIAGPILIYDDVYYQFKRKFPNLNLLNIWKGTQIFFIGFFKKIFIADKLIPWVNLSFSTPVTEPTSIDFFVGLISYGLQLYFDFSAYSDMAIGLALIFGLKLPVNFLSPYKSQSISEFWTRWHITLNRFLESLIYLPLAIKIRKFFSKNSLQDNLKIIFFTTLVTFFISGLWHGAGWNFIIWGLYHGFFVACHRSIIFLKNNNYIKYQEGNETKKKVITNIFLTNLVVFLSWVLFRSNDFSSAIEYYQILFNIFDGSWSQIFEYDYLLKTLFLTILFSICMMAPNSYELVNYKFKDQNFKNNKLFLKIVNKLHKYYFDLMIIIFLIVYYLKIATEDKPFIYYQF